VFSESVSVKTSSVFSSISIYPFLDADTLSSSRQPARFVLHRNPFFFRLGGAVVAFVYAASATLARAILRAFTRVRLRFTLGRLRRYCDRRSIH